MNAAFMPHGYCLNWTPEIVCPYVLANVAIGLAYWMIPFSLLWIFREPRAGNRISKWFALGFAVFIFACGTGHFLKAVVIWFPVYWLETYWDILTAAASLYVAVGLLIWSRYLARVLSDQPTREKLLQAYEQSRDAFEALHRKLDAAKEMK